MTFKYIPCFNFYLCYISITACAVIFEEIVMVFNSQEKVLVSRAIDTERARMKRSINAAPNQAIKEILSGELALLDSLAGRVSVEPVKG